MRALGMQSMPQHALAPGSMQVPLLGAPMGPSAPPKTVSPVPPAGAPSPAKPSPVMRPQPTGTPDEEVPLRPKNKGVPRRANDMRRSRALAPQTARHAFPPPRLGARCG
jgi:hypothetical protein